MNFKMNIQLFNKVENIFVGHCLLKLSQKYRLSKNNFKYVEKLVTMFF